MARRWPLVGRADQLAGVRRARRTPAGAAGVILVGPAGAGTTRLARAALDAAAADGAAVRWVMVARSASEIPLGAVAQLLPGGESAAVTGPDLLGQLAHRIADGADGRRLVIGVNDAHLLDPLSASLVHHLAVTRAAFLILAMRTDVAVPDPVFALWKEGLLERVDVSEFDRAQTEELVREAVGGQVDGATLHQLWQLSRGNALFLHELVESGLADGALQRVQEVWRWTGPMTPPRRLTDLVEARIRAVRADEQVVLEMLAFGGPLDGDVLLRLTDAETLAATEDRGLLVSERLGRRVQVRLAHPLYADVLRRRTSPLRERFVYRRLAEVFDRPGQPAVDQVRVVSWRWAGGLATDTASLLTAAEQGMSADDPDPALAARLAGTAVEQGGGFTASFLLGQALVAMERHDEAEAVLGGLVAEAGTDDRFVRLALTRYGNLRWGAGRPEAAADVLRAAVAGRRSDLALPDRTILRAALLLHEGRSADVLAAVRPLLDGPGTPGVATAPAHAVAVEALCGSGRHDDAIALAERGRAAAESTRDSVAGWARVQLAAGSCAAHVFAGRFDDAEQLATVAYREALDARYPLGQSMHAGWLGLLASLRGRVRTAVGWLRDATGAMPGRSFPLLPVLFAGTAVASAIRGDPVGARLAMEQAERAVEAGGSAAAGAWVQIASAWPSAAAGRVTDAVELATAAAARARERGQVQCELQALHACVRFGAAGRVVERIEAVGAGVQGRLAAAYVDHARALADSDPGELDAVAERFGALGALLLAAEAAAQATHLLARAGRSGAATMSATRARRWADACEDARTPALALLDATAELTPREREIAALAASGMTSRAIADVLVVSVRTVDNVLHGVYRKLGVTGRRDLAAVVGMHVVGSE